MGSIKKAFDLTGKNALVTGGSRGLGLQIAEALGEQGARVVISSRKAPDLEKAQAHHGDGEAYGHAKHMRDHVVPALANVRAAADKLETIVSDELWPLPTYREMLFIR